MDETEMKVLKNIGFVIAILILTLVPLGMYGCPKYNVWQQGLAGEAALRRAEEDRKILVEEAKAKLESSKSLALAEVERAKGAAEANRIIGESLKDNEVYLRYLWVQGLHDGNSEIIYIPTEANLPILEATRLKGK